MMPVRGTVGPVTASPRLAELTIVLLAVAASITGIGNGFALDDIAIIVQNDRIHSLDGIGRLLTDSYWPPEAGSSLYRPFTTIAFALQWAVGGGSPLPFHVTSILLYAAVSVALFRLTVRLAGQEAGLIAAGLFAVHPLHVEAVANAVGQAELWAGLFAILAVARFISARMGGVLQSRDVRVIAALFLAALLFKEHVIVLPAILVAAELTIFRNQSIGRKVRGLMPLALAMSAVAIAFIALRTAVLGSLHGGGTSPIFQDSSLTTRFFTMLGVVTEWARLFVWPAVLSADYSPSRIELAHRLHLWMLPGILVSLASAGLAIAARKRWPVVTFAIAWIAITLLIPSNLIVVTGFVLAERALFLASAGVCLVAGAGAVALLRSRRMTFVLTPVAVRALVALVITLGLARSASRNPVWRNNDTLIAQTVLDSPMSARAHMMMAQLHIDRGEGQAAVHEARLALRLGRNKDPQLFAFTADVFQMNDRCGTAMRLYWTSLALNPQQPQVRENAARCLARLGKTRMAGSVLSGQLPVASRWSRHHAVLDGSRSGESERNVNFLGHFHAFY
jgi:hypothetical protein